MENLFVIGENIKSKICPTLYGKIKELHSGNTAIVKVRDRDLNMKEMYVDLNYWVVTN